MKYFIAPRSGEKSYNNFQSTIKQGVPLSRIWSNLTEEGQRILSKEQIIYSWGNRKGKSSQWNKMAVGDLVIFYAKGNFVMSGTVIYKQQSPQLALTMWPPDEKGNPWEYTFFLNNLSYFRIPLSYFNYVSGYNFRTVQGFQEITSNHIQLLKQKYPDLNMLFAQFKDNHSAETLSKHEAVHVNIPTEVKSEYLAGFRLRHYRDIVSVKKSGSRHSKVIDFDEKHRRNALVGSKGEEVVIRHEINYLRTCGRDDLANKVKRVSLEDITVGYDILSYDRDGNEKKIEVKSTTLPNGRSFRFHISSNEKKVAEQCNNYWIYLVFDVNTNCPKIASFKNPFDLEGLLHIEPTQYLVKGQTE